MDREEVLLKSLENRKKAYFAMCAVSALLFAFAILSDAVGLAISEFAYESIMPLQSALVKLLCFFGVGKADALIAAKSFLSSSAYFAFTDILVSMITLVLPGLIFAKTVKLSFDEYFNVKGKTVKGFLFAFCLVQLFTLTSNMLSQGIMDFVLPSNPDMTFSYAELSESFDIYGFIMEFVSVGVFVPVAEELVFRGIILTYLKRFGNVFAVVASALVFGIAHSSPTQSVYAFVFGILAAFFAITTGNLKTGILLHAMNNAVMVLISHMPLVLGEELFEIVYCIFMAAVVLLSFVGIYMLVKNGGYADEFFERSHQHDRTLTVKPGMAQAIAFPVAVYIILYFIRYVTAVFG